jgi:hypothetical protein
MRRSPPKLIQAVVGLLLPPACREYVLGDLHERCTGALHYVVDALCALPLVIASRIRRTTDPDVFLMEALGMYTAFSGAAFLLDRGVLLSRFGLLRLAIPAAVILAVSTLAAAYADPRKRSPLQPIREAALGVAFAFLTQALLPSLSVPRWTMVAGAGMSLLLVSTLRMFFSSAVNRPQGATTNGPLVWQNPVTRLMEFVGLIIVVGGFGAMILFIVLLLQHKG